ncbi:MAG: hypothetical protein ACPG49_01630 [Chitinophagales bacterium]
MYTSKIFFGLCFIFSLFSFNLYAQEHYGITEKSPENYLYQCKMHDDQTFYYIMPNNDILIYDIGNEFKKVGTKILSPYGWTNFVFMLKLVDITYAVDKDGFIWQNKNSFREIVGQAIKNGSK